MNRTTLNDVPLSLSMVALIPLFILFLYCLLLFYRRRYRHVVMPRNDDDDNDENI